MGGSVNSACHSAHYGHACASEFAREPFGLLDAIERRTAGPNDCNGSIVSEVELTAAEQHPRRVVDVPQRLRKARVRRGDQLKPVLFSEPEMSVQVDRFGCLVNLPSRFRLIGGHIQ